MGVDCSPAIDDLILIASGGQARLVHHLNSMTISAQKSDGGEHSTWSLWTITVWEPTCGVTPQRFERQNVFASSRTGNGTCATALQLVP